MFLVAFCVTESFFNSVGVVSSRVLICSCENLQMDGEESQTVMVEWSKKATALLNTREAD